MPQITYSLAGTSFDAVPETLLDRRALNITSEATLSRAVVHRAGVAGNVIALAGKYMSPATRNAFLAAFEQCRATGATVVFNDGRVDRNVLISSFETTPLIGKTEGFSFRIELVVVA